MGLGSFIDHHVARAVKTATARLADPAAVVVVPADKIGFGNFCYLWLAADKRRRQGLNWSVMRTDPMGPWLEAFPALRELLVEARDVPRRATRVHDFMQVFDLDYSGDELRAFTRDRLASSGSFRELADEYASGDDTLVVNIRRGAYYSVPKYRGFYSFDVPAFVAEAMVAATASTPVRRVVLVSDDPDWCRIKLADAFAGVDEVVISDPDEGALVNLARLAGARRLVVANSTFSYWGAHIGRSFDADTQVIAPWFHSRHVAYGKAVQLDPEWTIIESIPGGWDA